MPVHFLDARSGQCRFPLWAEDVSTGDVCGEPTALGQSYCPACRANAYQATPPRLPFVPHEPAARRPRGDDVTTDLVEMVA